MTVILPLGLNASSCNKRFSEVYTFHRSENLPRHNPLIRWNAHRLHRTRETTTRSARQIDCRRLRSTPRDSRTACPPPRPQHPPPAARPGVPAENGTRAPTKVSGRARTAATHASRGARKSIDRAPEIRALSLSLACIYILMVFPPARAPRESLGANWSLSRALFVESRELFILLRRALLDSLFALGFFVFFSFAGGFVEWQFRI